MTIFSIFEDGTRRHLALSKGGNFRGGKGQEGQNASIRQISRQSAKPLLRYGHISIFQDGGRRHLGFLKGGNLGVGRGKRAKMRHLPNFVAIGQTVAEI